jgi:NADH dehydrogenase/NADH:ubiquinone oxidoreductase subunit G
MSTLEANGQQIEVRKGDTILQALRRGGIHVPTICHMEGLLPSGTCRPAPTLPPKA